ncbi:uncharacterized protein SPPG_06472, partial [Spizellomyces punctatus DAOM BR117]
MNYDLYGRGLATACGGAGWILRGMIDRISANAWSPRLSLKCRAGTVVMIGDLFGQSFRFQDAGSSRNVGTFALQTECSVSPHPKSAPSTPQTSRHDREQSNLARRSLRTAPTSNVHCSEKLPSVPSFPEKWELRVDVSLTAGNLDSIDRPRTSSRRNQKKSSGSRLSCVLPTEMFVAASLIVQHFMKDERAIANAKHRARKEWGVRG